MLLQQPQRQQEARAAKVCFSLIPQHLYSSGSPERAPQGRGCPGTALSALAADSKAAPRHQQLLCALPPLLELQGARGEGAQVCPQPVLAASLQAYLKRDFLRLYHPNRCN